MPAYGLGGLAVVLLLIRFIVLKKPQISGGPDIGTSMTIGGREVQEDQVETGQVIPSWFLVLTLMGNCSPPIHQLMQSSVHMES